MARHVPSAVYEVAPGLGKFTDEVLFGEVWQRQELAPRDRGLVTVAALVATGRTAQIGGHVERALDNGVKPGEIGELITQLAFYSGWPRAMSAVPVLEQVFASRKGKDEVEPQRSDADLQIVRATPGEGAEGPEATFSGHVLVSTLYQADAPARVGGATVSFAAAARTAWHTHPLGQTLYIVSGRGWVQKEGGPIGEVGAGDVVWIPPHVRHWHGASATEPMVHFAVAEALDGNAVTWLEKVTDEEYGVGPRTPR